MSILTTGGVIKSIRGVIGGVIYSMVTTTTAVVRTKKPKSKVVAPPKLWGSAYGYWKYLSKAQKATWQAAAAIPTSMPHGYKYGIWLFSWWYYWCSRLYLIYPTSYPTTIPADPGLSISVNTCQYSTLAMTVVLSAAAPATTKLCFQLGIIQTSQGLTSIRWTDWFYYGQDSSSISLIDISSQFENTTKLFITAAGDTIYIRSWLYFTAGGIFHGQYPMPTSAAFIIT